MAVKASDTITLSRIDDGTGYTILLSNEAYSFAGNTSTALAGSAYTDVIAYKNTTQVAATVSKIGTVAVTGNTTGVATGFTGLTADITSNGTNSCRITFKSTAALIIPSGNVEITISVDGKSFTKLFSFSVAFKGSTGATGSKGDDGYTLLLSNENHTFAATTTSAIASSVTCNVSGYKGASQVVATIGNITGAPTGMTVSIANNGTLNTSFTVSVTTSMTTKNGTLTIPIVMDGKSFTRTFSYSLSMTGATGATGSQGSAGANGTDAKVVTITASSQIFKSSDGGKTFLPSTVILTPTFQGGISFSKWQYSTNGSNWYDVVSGQNGFTVTSGNLTVSNASPLYTTTVTSIAYKCISNNAAYFDVMTVAKLYDIPTITNYDTYKIFHNICGYSNRAGTEKGYLIIETPITSSYMCKVDLTGYNYVSAKSNLDLSISFYAYTTSFLQHSFSSTGNYPISKVQLARKSDNTTIIVIGDATSQWDYLNVNIPTVSIGFNNPPDTWTSGWKMSISPTIPTSTLLTNLQGMDIQNQITATTTTMKGLEQNVNAVKNSITTKVWQSDITTQINSYDTSTSKLVRDRMTQVETDIKGIRSSVTDVQTILTKKADGSTVQTLDTKVSKMEQDANGFKQTVSSTYVPKSELTANYSTTAQMNSAITQNATSIKQEVSNTYETKANASKQYSSIDQKAESIKSTVTSVKTTADAANSFANNAKNNFGYQYSINVTLNGDDDKYYPVIIKGGDQNVKREIMIKRAYSEKAPEAWKGHPTAFGIGLTTVIKCNFGGWGGANYSWCLHDLEEMYGHVFAGAELCGYSTMFAIFLRGGGTTGAIYHLYSDQSLTTNLYQPEANTPSPQICYNSDPIFLSGTYKANAPAPRTYTSSVEEDLKKRLYINLAQKNYDSISSLEQTADKISSRVSNTEKGFSELLQTAGTIQQSISGLDGKMSSVTSTAENLKSRLSTAEGDISVIEATAKNLSTSVASIENNIGSKFEQTEQNFSATIQSLQNSLNDTLYKNFKFDSNGITITSGNSNITLRVDNTGIGFYNGSKLVAYINSNKLHITDATVVENMQIGNFGFTQMSNGSLSFGKI